MILKGSQRGGGRQLALHLLNDIENDHVTLHEVRGFVSRDLEGALREAHAVSLGTSCKQFLFSLSLNPPKDVGASLDELVSAADQAEARLGLDGQPRAIVIHEKQGRRHAHVVWSRIDAQEMKAVPLSFYKNRLAALSKELYLEHGWELPEGHRENGWKNPLNFTLAEWQQAKRLGLDPREIKQLFADAWRYSDGPRSFRAALEDRGYFLAQGDRRGFVAVDVNGEVFSVARQVGIKTKELEARLGSPQNLPLVSHVHAHLARQISGTAKQHLDDIRRSHREQVRPIGEERETIVRAQRLERLRLKRLQEERQKREAAARQARFRNGVRGLWDVLTGHAAAVRRDNERDSFEGYKRDAAQREQLFAQQLEERRDLDERMTSLRRLQRTQLRSTVEHVMGLLPDSGRERHRPNAGRELRL